MRSWFSRTPPPVVMPEREPRERAVPKGMRVGVMITDGGPHPPEVWAEMTADRIVEIGEQAPDALLKEARLFRSRLVELLTDHHGYVQDTEREAIVTHGMKRLEHDIDPTPHVDEPVQLVLEAAKGTSFESHFANPEVQDYLRRLLADHFATAIHIERSWHADRNPRTTEAQMFQARHHPKG